MSCISNLFQKIIQFALVLAIIGMLKDATLFMFKEAAEAHTVGLISLSKLNRNLTENSHKKNHPPNEIKGSK